MNIFVQCHHLKSKSKTMHVRRSLKFDITLNTIRPHFVTVLLAFLRIGLSGCSHKTAIHAFIVTKGGENIKLGLVEVRAIPYENAKEALTHAIDQQETEDQRIDSEIAEESKKYDEEDAAAKSAENKAKTACDAVTKAAWAFKKAVESGVQDIQGQIDAGNKQVEAINNAQDHDNRMVELYKFETDLNLITLKNTPGYSPDYSEYSDDETGLGNPDGAINDVSSKAWNIFPKQRDAILQTANALKIALPDAKAAVSEEKKLKDKIDVTNIRALTQQRKDAYEPNHFYSSLPAGNYSAKTDADGNCTLDLPSGQHWVIAASAGRDVGDDHEDYFWIIDLPDNTHDLTLSNDNLLKWAQKPLGL